MIDEIIEDIAAFEIDSEKYLSLMNHGYLKKKSLEDNVYFTLRDIFLNTENISYCLQANFFNTKLSGGIYYEERDDNFKYTEVLEEKIFLEKLVNWLCCIKENDFIFEKININIEKINLYENIRFDIWFEDLKILIKDLKERYKNIS